LSGTKLLPPLHHVVKGLPWTWTGLLIGKAQGKGGQQLLPALSGSDDEFSGLPVLGGRCGHPGLKHRFHPFPGHCPVGVFPDAAPVKYRVDQRKVPP